MLLSVVLLCSSHIEGITDVTMDQVWIFNKYFCIFAPEAFESTLLTLTSITSGVLGISDYVTSKHPSFHA